MTIQLNAGAIRATIDPSCGGRLASLIVDGRERLVVEPDRGAAMPDITWGSFVMVPWVGRMRRGELSWRGSVASVPRNLAGHAIHGVGFGVPWEITGATDRSAHLRLRLIGGAAWPFTADLEQSIELTPDSISFTVAARAEEPMPFAVGWHPWFRRAAGEPLAIRVPADHVLETSDDLIPTGALLDVAGPTDLRRSVAVGDRRLDHAYVGISGPSTIAWPDLEMHIDADPLRCVVVHTTADAVCIEPQTAWPDAIRLDALGSDTGLVELAPDRPFVAGSRWSFRRTAARIGT